MSIQKGEKIKARFYTHGGVKDVEKCSWICSCERKYQSKSSAQKCEDSTHKKIDTANLLNGMDIPIEEMTLDEKNVLGLLNCSGHAGRNFGKNKSEWKW